MLAKIGVDPSHPTAYTEQLIRHTRAARGVTGGISASCGLTEGDAYSCVVMTLCAIIWVNMVESSTPCTALSYADNFEVFSKGTLANTDVCRGTAITEEFSRAFRVTLDPNKS